MSKTPPRFNTVVWELMKLQTKVKKLEQRMDKKIHKITKSMEKAGKELKSAEKKNEKLVKEDKKRDKIIDRAKMGKC